MIRDNYGNRFLKVGNKFKLSCDIDHLAPFGPGIYLIFKLIKSLLILMSCIMPFQLLSLALLGIYSNHMIGLCKDKDI